MFRRNIGSPRHLQYTVMFKQPSNAEGGMRAKAGEGETKGSSSSPFCENLSDLTWKKRRLNFDQYHLVSYLYAYLYMYIAAFALFARFCTASGLSGQWLSSRLRVVRLGGHKRAGTCMEDMEHLPAILCTRMR